MDLKIESTSWTSAAADWLIVGVPEKEEFTGPLAELDASLQGQLTRLKEYQDLTGKLAEMVTIRDAQGITAKRLLLVGLGPLGELNEIRLFKAMLTAARHVSVKEKLHIAVAVPAASSAGTIPPAWVSLTAAAMQIAGVGQDLYRTEKQRFVFAQVSLLLGTEPDQKSLQAAANEGNILGHAVNLARELVNEPPQALFPISFAERAKKLAAEFGLHCEILDQPAMEQERMGSLLAVAKGSAQPPRLVFLEHQGGATDAPVLALCGKGVTFDSGGLSLKTNEGMLTMKCDMAGAATVLATMVAIARLKLPVHVIGLMGLVENMPSSTAFKLGDVLTARNGVTIEVHNTDAEGRLVLADVLSYAVDRGADYLVDLATLTGACVVALGEEVSGAFSNNQAWCDQILKASQSCGEDTWQLPMYDHYAELIKSDVADIKNVGGRWGGAITAAKFLERFVADKPWVHLDIAGPAFASASKPHREGGGTGCMVRSLVALARAFPPST